MDPIPKKRKLPKTENPSPSLSKKDLKKKKKKTKKQKVSKSLMLTNPSLETTSPSLMSEADVGEAMKKQNDVAMFLAEKVISTVAKNTNFVFSPASISTVLTMIAATSEEEQLRSFIFSYLRSSSIDELKAVFREVFTIVLVNGSESGGPNISAVNGVWMEQTLPVKPSLKDLLVNFFKANFALVDFKYKAEQVREEVNAWALNHTNGLIKEILPPDSVKSDHEWIYGNALYFKGAWEKPFTKSLTTDKEFHLLNGTSISVPFMSKGYSEQYIAEYEDFKVLKLPFLQSGDINRQFSMHFYLPDANDGLNNLVKKMASTPGFFDSHDFPTKKGYVGEFKIPKFKIEFGFEVLKVFKELLLDVKLYHKACVEMDEDGAEAAVSTIIGGRRGRRGPGPKRIDFVADHPFLFLIKEDKTETILFVGQIFDPSKSSSA